MSKTRNVLMTTMSILSNINVNYYYEVRDGKFVFCNGISSLEPGSKYFLSKYRIDEIVVVGTEETIKKDDIRKYEDVKSIYEEMKEMPINKEMMAYALYKMRISSYLMEKGQIGDGFDESALKCVAKNIPEKRKEELIVLFKQKCSKNPFFMTSDDLKQENGKIRSPWYLIENGIRESIDKDFEQTEDYKRYLHKIDNIMEYQEEYWKNLELEGNSDKVIDAIRKDNELSFIEKEYCYISLQKKVNEARLKNAIIDLKMDIANLEKINAQLQYEIDSLKNNRYTVELTYVKYIAYCELPEDNRIYPHSENINNDVAMRFVDERVGNHEKYDNINGIVNALYGITEDNNVQKDDETEINLYIDMQGGNRTSSYVRNAIISILNNQSSKKVNVKEIIGVNFIPGNQQACEIVNETKRYRIMDLVSGMNSFIRYGKADMIKSYYNMMLEDSTDEIKKSSKVAILIDNMVAVDDAISLCNIQALGEAVIGLSAILETDNEHNQNESDNFIDNVFNILRDGIKKDYGNLLELQPAKDDMGNVQKSDDGEIIKEIDYLELIDWCIRKGFLQQALTLIEDKMPIEYTKKKILTYYIKNVKDEEIFLSAVGPSYETRRAKKFFENLTKENCNIKVNELVWKMLWRVQRTDKSEDNNKERTMYNNKKGEEAKNSYIREKLKSHTKCDDSDFEINEDKLKLLISQMEGYNEDSEFIRLYCRFRNMSYDLEHGRIERNLIRVGNLYDVAKEKIDKIESDADKRLYSSILGYTEIGAEFVDKEQIIDGKPKRIAITVKRHNKLKNDYGRLLDEALLLHDALKQERNCSNHASEKGIRLPKELIIKAINIYVSNMRKIMKKIS